MFGNIFVLSYSPSTLSIIFIGSTFTLTLKELQIPWLSCFWGMQVCHSSPYSTHHGFLSVLENCLSSLLLDPQLTLLWDCNVHPYSKVGCVSSLIAICISHKRNFHFSDLFNIYIPCSSVNHNRVKITLVSLIIISSVYSQLPKWVNNLINVSQIYINVYSMSCLLTYYIIYLFYMFKN